MQAQQRGRFEDNRGTDQSARADEGRTQTGDHAIRERERLGERFLDRLRTSSWCLTSTDSATTERAPRDRRVGKRSPADAETGRPDRAPPDPTKIATRTKNAHEFGIRHGHAVVTLNCTGTSENIGRVFGQY